METKKKQNERVNIYLNPDLVKNAKMQAALDGLSLGEIIEKALNFYLAPALAVERSTGVNGTVVTFKSGPTISTMQPQFTTPANLGAAPLNANTRWEPAKSEPGVPTQPKQESPFDNAGAISLDQLKGK